MIVDESCSSYVMLSQEGLLGMSTRYIKTYNQINESCSENAKVFVEKIGKENSVRERQSYMTMEV